ncbi:MAG: hypothetical protein ACON4Z_16900 [Planctomycetota bacterium]
MSGSIKVLVAAILASIAVAAGRYLGQVQGWIPTTSGGSLHPLGVSWLPFVFGPVFAARLAREGSAPRWRRARLVSVAGFAAIVVVVMWKFAPIADLPKGAPGLQEATNSALFAAFVTTLAVTALLCVLWGRLALTIVCYAVPVRLAVLALTAIAKQSEVDTHYTKFGPAGNEFDLWTTVSTAAVAQLGFWVPFAVVCGFASGTFFAKRPAPQA